MTKQDSSSDTESGNDVVVVDTEDAVEFEADSEPVADVGSEVEPEAEPEPVLESPSKAKPDTARKPRRSWFGFFNFLLIVALAAAAGYYWWQQQQLDRERKAALSQLEQALATKASQSAVETKLAPISSNLGALQKKLETLESGQQDLRTSSEKLYELYGRDKNDWQLAEVEYLMRVAQHKLILQDDFEGAAITLQAASDKIALTGDPGLLSVRVMISEEIADLKTRGRPDLVGMTLILAQLARQVRVLEPGFALRVEETVAPPPELQEPGDWLEKLDAFVDSLVTIRYEDGAPSQTEATTINVSETLEDNLKLARWAVLERDARQYSLLIEQSLRLFREFYDLDNAANDDFLKQLQNLQKIELRPEKPDIDGSLRELRRILSQRENAPVETEPASVPAQESGNG